MINFIDDNITRVRRRVLQEIIQRFYKDFSIAHNFISDGTAMIKVDGRKSFYINNVYMEGFSEYAMWLGESTKHGLASDCTFRHRGLTEIVPKPKSYEHMARRGMAWLFNNSSNQSIIEEEKQ